MPRARHRARARTPHAPRPLFSLRVGRGAGSPLGGGSRADCLTHSLVTRGTSLSTQNRRNTPSSLDTLPRSAPPPRRPRAPPRTRTLCPDPVPLTRSGPRPTRRSAAHLKLGHNKAALEDAQKCNDLNADFAKGYLRKGQALFKLEKFDEACGVYAEGLENDSDNKALADARDQALAAGMGGGKKTKGGKKNRKKKGKKQKGPRIPRP